MGTEAEESVADRSLGLSTATTKFPTVSTRGPSRRGVQVRPFTFLDVELGVVCTSADRKEGLCDDGRQGETFVVLVRTPPNSSGPFHGGVWGRPGVSVRCRGDRCPRLTRGGVGSRRLRCLLRSLCRRLSGVSLRSVD